jgi:hypothetical protein
MRELRLEDGTVVTVSLEIKEIGYHLWASLRFKRDRLTTRKYVGRATADSRYESLCIGWALVRSKRVVEAHGWAWVRGSKQ